MGEAPATHYINSHFRQSQVVGWWPIRPSAATESLRRCEPCSLSPTHWPVASATCDAAPQFILRLGLFFFLSANTSSMCTPHICSCLFLIHHCLSIVPTASAPNLASFASFNPAAGPCTCRVAHSSSLARTPIKQRLALPLSAILQTTLTCTELSSPKSSNTQLREEIPLLLHARCCTYVSTTSVRPCRTAKSEAENLTPDLQILHWPFVSTYKPMIFHLEQISGENSWPTHAILIRAIGLVSNTPGSHTTHGRHHH